MTQPTRKAHVYRFHGMIEASAEWSEVYAGVYHATCDRCGHSDNGTFWILGSHDNGTLCQACYAAKEGRG